MLHLPRFAQRAASESALRVGADSRQANSGRLRWAVKTISCSQWNGGFGAHSGPSRGYPRRRASRPIEASKTVVCYVRFTSTPAFIADVDLTAKFRPFETIALTDCPKARSLSDRCKAVHERL